LGAKHWSTLDGLGQKTFDCGFMIREYFKIVSFITYFDKKKNVLFGALKLTGFIFNRIR